MNLEVAILNVLRASPRAIPATVIQGYLPAFTGKAETLDDINAALTSLNRKGHAKGTANEDHGAFWTATEDGKLRIA